MRWFNPAKGYGFIRPRNGGGDVFVGIAAVQAAGLDSLREGQVVTYDASVDRGKAAAINLKPV